ncbi:unnamed protein product [Adineta ricciae]|nr:unnamed protein product [Adineta ricciae]
MDQGIIRAFKAHYRRNLVKYIIARAGVVTTAEDISITALDAVYWIDSAWAAITETTVRNTFKSAGFEKPFAINDIDIQQISIANEVTSAVDKSIEELDRILVRLSVGGRSITAIDYVCIDDNTPSFNESDDSTDKLLTIHGIINDDFDNKEDQLNDDLPSEESPTLSECLELVRRLRLFSITQQPELHSFIIQLESKLTDALLDSNMSKQRSILEYFRCSTDRAVIK